MSIPLRDTNINAGKTLDWIFPCDKILSVSNISLSRVVDFITTKVVFFAVFIIPGYTIRTFQIQVQSSIKVQMACRQWRHKINTLLHSKTRQRHTLLQFDKRVLIYRKREIY